MTLGELLRQFAGDSEPVRLAEGPASYRTRGRLPLPTMPSAPTDLGRRGIPSFRDEPIERVFPMQPTTRRVRLNRPPADPMAAYPTFADYANSEMGLRVASGLAPQEGVGGYAVNPATGRPMTEPASAPEAQAPPGPELDAHLRALVDALTNERREAQARDIPRPGNALLGQFLSNFGPRRNDDR